MGLLFEPEKKESLKARFMAALGRVYDVAKIVDHESDRPGQHRENVFDFEDGVRLIISAESFDGSMFFHVSGSHQSGSLRGKPLFEDILNKVSELHGVITGESALVTETDAGVVHLVLRIEEKSVDFASDEKGNTEEN